ncbi:MAG: hypothetical protein CMC13_09760 [Flavobacteriaceae bacterium]|nr:hypothetical protein [Flavobacteriaceae bacterium]|tara:strand:- start:668 stop:1120 length:453 start_codon:yes stop_codon:yes gene_type:complete
MKSTSSLPATHEIQTQPTIKSSVQIAIENFTKQYLQKHSDTFENELDRSVRYLYHDHRPLKKLESVVATMEQWENDLQQKELSSEKLNSITPQEHTIIDCISKGMQTKEIATHLFISEHTVQTHRKNINKKLGTSSIIDLMKVSMLFSMR